MSNRRPCITAKISRDVTGLNGSLFVHAEFDAHGRIDEIRISEKGRDFSTLDNVLHAISDTVTGIIRDSKGGDDVDGRADRGA